MLLLSSIYLPVYYLPFPCLLLSTHIIIFRSLCLVFYYIYTIFFFSFYSFIPSIFVNSSIYLIIIIHVHILFLSMCFHYLLQIISFLSPISYFCICLYLSIYLHFLSLLICVDEYYLSMLPPTPSPTPTHPSPPTPSCVRRVNIACLSHTLPFLPLFFPFSFSTSLSPSSSLSLSLDHLFLLSLDHLHLLLCDLKGCYVTPDCLHPHQLLPITTPNTLPLH